MATLEPNKIKELDLASARIASGGAMGAVKDASGKIVNAGDQANIDYASENFGYKYNPITPAPAGNVGLADAVDKSGNAGYDAALAAQKEADAAAVSETDWMGEWMKSAFGQGDKAATDQVEAPTFDVEKARLQEAKTSRIQALDAQYATNLATLQKKNKDLGSSLKARLMKLGVSPSDSAWSNAEAGQAQRDAEAEAGLRAEYMSNKAAIESDLDAKIANIAMNEATMQFNATVKNIENKLATQAQGINLYQIFSSRDQSEKDREQQALQFGQTMEYNLMTFDDQKQQTIAQTLMQNAQAGMYNVSDKATLEMLTNLEKQSPYLKGLTGVASAGLTDRLDQKAQMAAELALTKAQTGAANRSNTGGGPDPDKMTDEEKAFDADLKKSLAALSEDKNNWGREWNYLNAAYDIDPAELDRVLRKDMFFPEEEPEKESVGGKIRNFFGGNKPNDSTNSTPAMIQ